MTLKKLHVFADQSRRVEIFANPSDHFRLNDSFLKPFVNRKPNFGYNGLGEFVFYRTYSRLTSDGTKEDFYQVLKRVVEGCYEIQRRHCANVHVPWDYGKAQVSAQTMFDLMWNFKFLPPGRGLWCMGTQFVWERGSAALNNCAFVSSEDLDTDPAEPFCFLMDMSMLGVGVGFDTAGKNLAYIVRPNTHVITSFVIPDSREGWVESVRLLIKSFTTNPEIGFIDYDYSFIRKANEPIKGFGGLASGPDVLIGLHVRLRELLVGRIGFPLDSCGIVDIMNIIGAMVVAGNVRRCLPKGTLINLKRGLTPIEQVVAGDEVMTSGGFYPVSELVKQGKQQVLQISTQAGDLRCTAKHEVAVMLPDGHGWVKAQDLRIGDQLVFVADAIHGVETTLPDRDEAMDDDFGYLLGILVSSQTRIVENVLYFALKPMIMSRVERILSTLGVAVDHDGTVTDDGFITYLRMNSLVNRVHDCILKGTIVVRSAFIAALFDTSIIFGGFPSIASVNGSTLANTIAHVHASLGIPVKVAVRDGYAVVAVAIIDQRVVARNIALIEPYALTIEHTNETKKVVADKLTKGNRTLVDIRPGDDLVPFTVPIEVTGIRIGLVVDTYDLSVPLKHELVTNGLLVHNTAEIAFGEIDDFEYSSMKNYGRDLTPEQKATFDTVTAPFYAAKINRFDIGDYMKISNAMSMKLAPGESPPSVGNEQLDKTIVGIRDYMASQQGTTPENGAKLCGISPAELERPIAVWNSLNQYRWASNNSIFAKVGSDYSYHAKQTAANGEPGYVWLDNIRNYGRLIDGRQPGIDARVKGTNPCFSGEMRLLTNDGYRTMRDMWQEGGYQEFIGHTIDKYAMLNRYGRIDIENRHGKAIATNVYRTSKKAELFRITVVTGDYVEATENHKFVVVVQQKSSIAAGDSEDRDEKIEMRELKDLKLGDFLRTHHDGRDVPIVTITALEAGETFCLTELQNHEVTVNNLCVGQCGEQALESFELCTLVETYPANHRDDADYWNTAKYAYLYAKTVTLMPTHNARTNAVMLRNRRIGLSQSGIVQAFEKFGRRNVLANFCDKGYSTIKHWDKIYSEWLCVPTSIKITSVKPSGTISLICAATPGIHYPKAKYYWRNVRLPRSSVLVSILERSNYRVEPAMSDPENTVVATFAVDESNVPSVDDVTIWEQVMNVVDYQTYWTDNQPSCTIEFRPHEAKDVQRVLEVFDDRLKAISFMPQFHGYTQAPYIPCTREEVEAYNAQTLPLDFKLWLGGTEDADAQATKFCDGANCMVG